MFYEFSVIIRCMRKTLITFLSIIVIASLTACSSGPKHPKVHAGASHSTPIQLGEGGIPAWVTNSIKIRPLVKTQSASFYGVSVRPTPNTRAGVGVDWYEVSTFCF